MEVDLPAPKAGGGAVVDLPAPKAAGGPADLEVDLPAPKARGTARGTLDELDLPTPKVPAATPKAQAAMPRAPARRTPFDDLDDLPAPRVEADLPAPKASAAGAASFGDLDLDLPMPKGEADLPMPKPPARPVGGGFDDLDLPMPKAGADLPMPKQAGGDAGGFGDLDLPMPKSAADLPAPRDVADLPVPRGTADLPVAKGEADLPAPWAAGGLADLDLPVAKGEGDLPAPREKARFDDLELPVGAGDFDLPVPRAGGPEGAAQGPARAGGVGFGEIDLGGDDELEFADIPQEAEVPGGAGLGPNLPDVASAVAPVPGALPVRPRRQRTASRPARVGRGSGRSFVMVGSVLAVLVAAGVGLMFTPYGLFGIYALERFLPAAGDPATVHAAIARAEKMASSDTYADVRGSLVVLGRARREAGLNRLLLARSMMEEALYQVRFGEDSSSTSRIVGIRARLAERSFNAPGMDAALAADALREGKLGMAHTHLAKAQAAAPDDPYVQLIAGELALASHQSDTAIIAFRKAEQQGGGARATWGLARALLTKGSPDAPAAVDATLAASPRHVMARVAKARQLFTTGDDEERDPPARRGRRVDAGGRGAAASFEDRERRRLDAARPRRRSRWPPRQGARCVRAGARDRSVPHRRLARRRTRSSHRPALARRPAALPDRDGTARRCALRGRGAVGAAARSGEARCRTGHARARPDRAGEGHPAEARSGRPKERRCTCGSVGPSRRTTTTTVRRRSSARPPSWPQPSSTPTSPWRACSIGTTATPTPTP